MRRSVSALASMLHLHLFCCAAFVPSPKLLPRATFGARYADVSSQSPSDQRPAGSWAASEVGSSGREAKRRPAALNMQATGQKGAEAKGESMLRSANIPLIRILVQGEVAVGTVASILAAIAQINPLAGLDFTWPAVGMGCLGALPIFFASVLLEKSGVLFFRQIDQDTKLYVVQVFGAERNWRAVSLWSAVLAANAGFFEELLFRGVIQQWLTTVIGGWPALGVASVLFGLAHNPVPGASSFTEACYGANFGLLYMMSGGNILVPIVAHIVYDFLTFVEVHNRVTAELEVTLKGSIPQKQQAQRNIEKVKRQFSLSAKFVDMSYAVFKQLDLDDNDGIDLRELQLGLRTFGKFTSNEETRQIMQKADLDENNVISFDEWLRLLALNYSALLQDLQGEKPKPEMSS